MSYRLMFDARTVFFKINETLSLDSKRIARYYGLKPVEQQILFVPNSSLDFTDVFNTGHFPEQDEKARENARKQVEQMEKLKKTEGSFIVAIKGYEMMWINRKGSPAIVSISLIIGPTEKSKVDFADLPVTMWSDGGSSDYGHIARYAKIAQDKDRSALCFSTYVQYYEFEEIKKIEL